MTVADHATAVQLVRAFAADHLTHLTTDQRDEVVQRITGALDRCAAKAWDDGFAAGWLHLPGDGRTNPYRETT